MPVTVKTFATSGRGGGGARRPSAAPAIIGGGTLVMRALNEGDLVDLDHRRATRPRPDARRTSRARASTSAPGSRWRAILAERDLAFLHPVARSIGGPAVRNMGDGRRQSVRARAVRRFRRRRCSRSTRPSRCRAAIGARDMPLEEFLAGRDRACRRGSSLVGLVQAPRRAPTRSAIARSRASSRRAASVVTIAAHLPNSGGRVTGARVAYGAMAADAGARQGRRARARRAHARRGGHRRRRRRGGGGHFARRRFARQRLVPARGRRRASAPRCSAASE